MTTAFPPNTVARNPNSGADLDILTLLISKNQPLYGAITARSYHSGGVNAVFADGSVHFIKTPSTATRGAPSGRSPEARSSAPIRTDDDPSRERQKAESLRGDRSCGDEGSTRRRRAASSLLPGHADSDARTLVGGQRRRAPR